MKGVKGLKVLKETLCNYFYKGDDDSSKSEANGDPEDEDMDEQQCFYNELWSKQP